MNSSRLLLSIFALSTICLATAEEPLDCLSLADARKVEKRFKPGSFYVEFCEDCPGPIRVIKVVKVEVKEGCEQEVHVAGNVVAETEKKRKYAGANPKFYLPGGKRESKILEADRAYVEAAPNVFRRVDGLLGIQKRKNSKTFSLPKATYAQLTGKFDSLDPAERALLDRYAGQWLNVKAEGGGGAVLPKVSAYRECDKLYASIDLSKDGTGNYTLKIVYPNLGGNSSMRVTAVDTLKPVGYRLTGITPDGTLLSASVLPDLHPGLFASADTTMAMPGRGTGAVIPLSGFVTWDFPNFNSKDGGSRMESYPFTLAAKQRTLPAVDGLVCKAK